MNVCDGSGGITWIRKNNCFYNAGYTGYHAIPKGYYTQFDGVGNLGVSALGQACVYDKAGVCKTDASHTAKFLLLEVIVVLVRLKFIFRGDI